MSKKHKINDNFLLKSVEIILIYKTPTDLIHSLTKEIVLKNPPYKK